MSVEEIRRQILLLNQLGYTVSQIAREVGVSRPTVYKTLERARNPEEDPLLDKRKQKSGRKRVYGDEVLQAVASVRSQYPFWGAMLIRHELKSNAAKYGLTPEQVPSVETIALMIRELGLARKPVSPKDSRTFPDVERPTQPGWCTIDLFGPWRLRATRAWLVTLQDRFTRASLAIPAYSAMYSSQQNVTMGVTANLWKQAVLAGTTLCGRIKRLYCDNGMGMAPINNSLPSALRFALKYCDSVVFIPPGQPWRNGRLERFHRTLLTEWLLRSRPKTIAQFEQELYDYLAWYNNTRPHRALNFQAPADMVGNIIRFSLQDLEALRAGLSEPDGEFGTIECIRMVGNNGEVQLWQDSCKLPEVLGGQYVRFEFNLAAQGENYGRVLWQRKRGEDVVVAEFTHSLLQGKRLPLITGLVPREFAHDVPANQKLDEAEYAYPRAKRYKQPYKASEIPSDAPRDA